MSDPRPRRSFFARRVRILAACALLVAADEPGTGDASLWVTVDTPADGETFVSGPPWAELRGWAGTQGIWGHDVVVIVDLSGSTANASGVDVDGDGEVGQGSRRKSVTRFVSSDPDDSVLAAELRAIRRLSDQVDRSRNRLGIVSFSGRPRTETSLGTTHDDLELALRNLEGAFAGGGTDLAAAIAHATRMLVQTSDGTERPRQRSLLILSDGEPTLPPPASTAGRAAIEATTRAALEGIRTHAFALHLPAEPDEDEASVYARIAEVGGGSLVRVERPGEVIHELPEVRLGGVADVEVSNQTTGEDARALRVFADGSFDAFVRLVQGANRVRVSALSDAGERVDLVRTIRFEPREPRDADEAAEFERRRSALLERLRARAAETELARRASEHPEPAVRDLELGVEPDE